MIASLRRRHRLLIVGLSAGLPALLAASLLDRPQMPNQSLPGELLAHVDGAPLERGEAAFSTLRATLNRYADALELDLSSALRAPDVLAYASSQAADSSTGLPDDARLLGAVDPHRPNLYPVGAEQSGHLVLYSLGHQQVVDSTPYGAVAGYTPPAATAETPVATANGENDGGVEADEGGAE